MTILKIKLLGAALFFVSTTVFAEPTYFAVNGIPDASSLVLRAWPSPGSQPVNNIPHNAVKIEATGKQIFKDDKQWLQVIYQNNIGWAEANYLTPMQVFIPQPATDNSIQTNDAVNTTSFSYIQQVTPEPQATPQDVPWTSQQDTIYHDPTIDINLVERVETTHSLVVISSNQDQGDFKGENIASGNRYGDIQATMSVVYQP